MFKDLPQCVPQRVCLSCDGCCRFDSRRSDWRPKVGADELYAWQRNRLGGLKRNNVDEKGFIPTEKYARQDRSCKCTFFNVDEGKCTLYAYRPFECQLYPFVLRKKDKKVMVSFHLACPHMQDIFGQNIYKRDIEKLKKFFYLEDVQKFIRQNQNLITNYDKYHNEIEDVFELGLDLTSADDQLMSRRLLMGERYNNQRLPLASHDASALLSWKDFFDIDIRQMGGAVCIFLNNDQGSFMPFHPFCKDVSMDMTMRCFDVMNAININPEISRIENIMYQHLKNFDRKIFRYDLKGYEYYYYKKELIELKGNSFKSKRSDYNHFVKNYDYIYRAFCDEDFDHCVELYSQWSQNRKSVYQDDIYRHMLNENSQVHKVILTQWRQLGLIGRVVEVDGRIAAYTFGYPMGENIFCVMIEVADVMIKGLPVYIFRAFCRDQQLEQFNFINTMDDCCLPNIAEVKEAFHPTIMNPSYTIRLR